MSSPSRLNRPPRGIFTREDFERAWQSDPPPSSSATPATAIVVCRNSPDDYERETLTVAVDDQPLGKIQYGQVFTHQVAPGRHLVSVFSGWCAETLAIEARADERVRLRCGRGIRSPRWLRRVLPFVASFGVWLARD